MYWTVTGDNSDRKIKNVNILLSDDILRTSMAMIKLSVLSLCL